MKFSDLIQSADWKAEKHVPVIDAPDKVKAGEKAIISVSVGKEIAHPNTTEHHIRWIKLYFKADGAKFPYEVASFDFTAHGESVDGANKGPVFTEPASCSAVKLSASGTLIVTSYCNIHGLWEGSKAITVE